jgi:hypothetical protein
MGLGAVWNSITEKFNNVTKSVTGYTVSEISKDASLEVSFKEDYTKFKNKIESLGGDPELKPALEKILGVGNDGAREKKLDKLAEMGKVDPDIFKKLNGILNADGATGFLKKAAQDENLSKAFQKVLSNPSGDAAQGAKMINSLYGQVADNPHFFGDIDKFSQDHPKMFKTAAGLMASNPEEGMEMIGGVKKMGSFFGQLKGMLPANVMQSLQGLIQIIAPQLDKMLASLGFENTGLSDMLKSAVNNDGGAMSKDAGVKAANNDGPQKNGIAVAANQQQTPAGNKL